MAVTPDSNVADCYNSNVHDHPLEITDVDEPQGYMAPKAKNTAYTNTPW